MTGRYLIYTPIDSARDERRFRLGWQRFAETCRSLHRGGLAYSVEINLTHLKPHVVVVASGIPKPCKQSATRGLSIPLPIPPQRCRERALEAEWFLPENRERRNSNTPYWRTHHARYRELTEMAEEFIRGEAEFWREMELLSGQRQHFKPVRTDAAPIADDEVAA